MAEDESLEEANLTDPSNSPRDNSMDTNNVHRIDDSVDLIQPSGSMPLSNPNAAEPVQNIDMFMACCDWEAAIEAERQYSNDDFSNQSETQLMQNNGIEGELRNENSNTIKQCKRKSKMDLKITSNLGESVAQKQEASEDKVAGIDIDSMMKKTTHHLPMEMQRRAQKRSLQQRFKKRSPVKQ